ncbi:uncharacterized protein LOC126996522 [Eriocheir sinensis]|uniref:uncharacterized protein LOC126996522 n=1 Tax=Eriocheir sinensis TaxID=95602 RepID=UPI0021C73C65|nr:uncharacterized protein LOC126996522 [Eriocheir sinensis]XP_050713025.1 uncharacterized protein LOC126996522 [Eriocheir sinensis]
MADMLEYYQQISDLKKAVRERELQRLELEKQALLSAQKRERRHEDFKDKIRAIQRELNQREMDAAKNFQTLLARVESIRKEHQLLAAHTEQLRHRKLQYEMSLKSENPLLHSAVHQDSSGIFNTSGGEALWKGSFQPASTPASKSQTLWASTPSRSQQLTHSLPPQPLVSPVTSYSAAPTSLGLTQPMERYMPRGNVSVTSQQQPPYNVRMTNLMPSSNGQIQEPITQGGMLSHMPSRTDKIPDNYNQQPHIYPSTSPLTSLSNNSLPQEQMPSYGLPSETSPAPAKTSSAYNQPSIVDYKSLADIYKTEGDYRNQTDRYSTARGNIEHRRSSSLNGSQTHNLEKPFTDRPTSSNSAHLQSFSNPTAAETNYLTHLQATLQPQPQATHLLQPQQSTLHPQPQSVPQTNQPPTIPAHLQSTVQPQLQLIPQTLQPSPIPAHLQSTLQPQLQSVPQTQQPLPIPAHLQSTFQPQLQSVPQTQQPSTSTQPPYFPSQFQSALSSQQPSALQPQPQSNLHSQQHSLLEQQKYAETNPLQTREYLTSMHNNPLVTSTNGAAIHTPEKLISMNGDAGKDLGIMSHHLESLPYDSLTQDRSSSNYTLHPDLAMQHNNVTHPTTSGIYMTQPDPYINRDLPEKDVSNLQAPSSKTPSLNEDPIETVRLPSSSRECEITKNLGMLNIDNKPREMFNPRKYDERTQNGNEVEIFLNSNTSSLTPDIPRTGDNTHGESEQRESLHSPRKPTLDSTLLNENTYLREGDHDRLEHSPLTNLNNTVNIKQDNVSKPHQSPLMDNRNTTLESKSSETITNDATNDSLKDNGHTSLTHPEEEKTQKMFKSPDSSSSSSKETTSSSPPKTGSPPRPDVPTRSAGDSDFFDQNINVKDSVAYKSLVSGGRRGTVGMESESDEAEEQLSALTTKPQTTPPRPVFKPFAASIPSLRPAPADTDTDSVDSVEAAIQAAMKKKDQAAASESSSQVQQPQSPLKEEEKSEPSTEQKGVIKPGTDRVLGTSKPKAAVPINLESDAESYEVSVGADASDEDDFDFYDKF